MTDEKEMKKMEKQVEEKKEAIQELKTEIKALPAEERKPLIKRIDELEEEVFAIKIAWKGLKEGIENDEKERKEKAEAHKKLLDEQNKKKKSYFDD